MRHYRQYILELSLPEYKYYISYTYDKKWHAVVQSMDRDDIRFFTSRSPRCVKKMYQKNGYKVTSHWRTVTPMPKGESAISILSGDW